jgi:hypothetical protein
MNNEPGSYPPNQIALGVFADPKLSEDTGQIQTHYISAIIEASSILDERNNKSWNGGCSPI